MKVQWSAPAPMLSPGVHRLLADTCIAAVDGANDAWRRFSRTELAEEVRQGADGTPTMRIDDIVEGAILDVARRYRVNVLSEEVGFVDEGSVLTLVVDPLDGSANAAAGVPLSCFSAVLLDDGVPVEALTTWLETGRSLSARAGEPVAYRTSGSQHLKGSALSMLRPKVGARGDTSATWHDLTQRAGRVRILSTTCLEAMLVADGSIDAFADPGSDTHRIVDLAAAMLTVPAAGGVVRDAFGRALEFDRDLTLRYSGVIAASEALAAEIIEVIAQ